MGSIIAQGYVADIAQHAGGTNSYNVNLKPVIKCDIKDGKVRVTYTIPFYSVNVAVGGGWIGSLGVLFQHIQMRTGRWTLVSLSLKKTHTKRHQARLLLWLMLTRMLLWIRLRSVSKTV